VAAGGSVRPGWWDKNVVSISYPSSTFSCTASPAACSGGGISGSSPTGAKPERCASAGNCWGKRRFAEEDLAMMGGTAIRLRQCGRHAPARFQSTGTS
jgi:hypothetical protein